MNTITLLRKEMPNGYLSTWRFGTTADGRYQAVSNRGERKSFTSEYALEQCVKAFIGYGYAKRSPAAAPVKKPQAV